MYPGATGFNSLFYSAVKNLGYIAFSFFNEYRAIYVVSYFGF